MQLHSRRPIQALLGGLLLVIYSLPGFAGWAPLGTPLIEQFTHADYPLLTGQSSMFVQDNLGMIYLTDERRVLRFDGEDFTAMPVPNGIWTGIAMDPVRDRVYLSGYNRFGYLAPPDRYGVRNYVSLRESLPDSLGDPFVAYPIRVTNQHLWAITGRHLLHFDSRDSLQLAVPAPEGSIYQQIIIHNGDVYGHARDFGTFRLDGRDLELLPGTETVFDHYFIRGLHPLGGDSLLIVSEDRGIYLYDGRRTRRMDSPLSDYAVKSGAMASVLTRDGRLAITTFRGGVMVARLDGSIDHVITRSDGLASDNSYGGIFEDREGGLWVATIEGLNRIELSSGITRFTEADGIAGTPLVILRRPRDFWVGSTKGIYRMQPSNPGASPSTARFASVDSVHGLVVKIFSTPSGLYVPTNVKVHRVRPDMASASSVHTEPHLGTYVADLTTDQRLYLGNTEAIYRLDLHPGWLDNPDTLRYPMEFTPWRSLVVGDTAYWVSGVVRDDDHYRLMRVNIREDSPGYGQMRVYGKEDGLPPGGVRNPVLHNGRLLLTTSSGFMRHDPVRDRFVPADELNRLRREDESPPSYASTDTVGGVWFVNSDWTVHGITAIGDGYTRVSVPNLNRGGRIRSLNATPDGSALWVGHNNGQLLRYDPAARQSYRPLAPPVIGSVAIPAEFLEADHDSLIYGGPATKSVFDVGLGHDTNALRFDYGLPVYDGRSENQYRTRLVGLNEVWSPWTEATYRDFTGLNEGDYVFEVQARDVNGRLTPVTTLAFSVRPPWFRTAWAFILWSLLTLAGIMGIVALRDHRNRMQQRKLEALVERRTEQLRIAHEEERRLGLEAERLATKNKLAATIAHEFNNPLAVIQGMSELLKRDPELSEEDLDRIERIRAQVKRMHTNVKQLIELEELREVHYAAGSTIIDLHGRHRPGSSTTAGEANGDASGTTRPENPPAAPPSESPRPDTPRQGTPSFPGKQSSERRSAPGDQPR